MQQETQQLRLEVLDSQIGEPIPQADVTVRVPAEGVEEKTQTGDLGDDCGVVECNVAPRVKEVEVDISHERYHDFSTGFYVSLGDIERQFSLDRKEGQVSIHAVSPDMSSPAEIHIHPEDEFVQDVYAPEVSISLPEHGAVNFPMITGRYRVSLSDDISSLFAESEISFTVTDGDAVTKNFTPVTNICLTENQQQIISSIREMCPSDRAHPLVDRGVESYFEGVVQCILKEIEWADAHDSFSTPPEYPTEKVISGALEAVKKIWSDIRAAMESDEARTVWSAVANSDRDFASADGRWGGSVNIDTLLVMQQKDIETLQEEYDEKYTTVGERLDDVRNEGIAVDPFIAIHDRLGDFSQTADVNNSLLSKMVDAVPIGDWSNGKDSTDIEGGAMGTVGLGDDDMNGSENGHKNGSLKENEDVVDISNSVLEAPASGKLFVGMCVLDALESALDTDPVRNRLIAGSDDPDVTVTTQSDGEDDSGGQEQEKEE
jgi:hypothetical protein